MSKHNPISVKIPSIGRYKYRSATIQFSLKGVRVGERAIKKNDPQKKMNLFFLKLINIPKISNMVKRILTAKLIVPKANSE